MPSTSAERQRSRTMSESQRKAAAAITATCAGPCVGEVLKDRRTGYFYFISPFWVCGASSPTNSGTGRDCEDEGAPQSHSLEQEDQHPFACAPT